VWFFVGFFLVSGFIYFIAGSLVRFFCFSNNFESKQIQNLNNFGIGINFRFEYISNLNEIWISTNLNFEQISDLNKFWI
jgi:hypothetical protein